VLLNLPPLSPQPLVSIVTPSYNQANFLEQTLRSVLEQDYPRFEYLVVDGASTDQSVEIIKKYASRDGLTPSIRWWVSEKDNGQGEAINKGLARATGEIIAWLNSDDYYLPNAISSVVKVFQQNPDAVLIYGDMLAVDENGQTFNLLKYRQLSLEDLLCFQIIGQPAVFFRREAYEQTGGLDATFHFLLDHHLWVRIAQHGRILHTPQTWAAARYHPQAKNRLRAAEFGREAFRILDWAQKQPGLKEPVAGIERRARASAHRVDARYLLDAGYSASALQAWARAFVIHPPTALARLNLFVSALLQLSGLGALRKLILQRRQRGYSQNRQKS
jgi:GT2 family glycosyltransferase